MGEYFDSAYVAADGVILFYEDDDVSLNIPGKLGDMNIETLGEGSFMESNTIEYVSIPAGVKKIGKNAFKGCMSLKSISIPDTVQDFGSDAFADCRDLKNLFLLNNEVDEHKYLEMKASWMCANGSVFVANSFPDDTRLKSVVSAVALGPANLIQDGISRLFTVDKADDIKIEHTYTRQSCLAFGSRSSYISEDESFGDMKEIIGSYETDALSEGKNDQFLKNETVPEIKKTAIISFDDNKTRYENGKYYLLYNIMIGYHFWQSLVPVNMDGKIYYVYRRHYLSSTTNLNYIRKEVKVFSDQGKNTVLEEAQRVNAKYKLLSIL